jgi:hypothetical protein
MRARLLFLFEGGDMELRSVDPLSVAKILGAMYAAMGLVFGCLFALIGLVAGPLASGRGQALPGFMFGIGAVIVLPILYGGMGLVSGAIGGWLYNVFADLLGGVRVDLQPPGSSTAAFGS